MQIGCSHKALSIWWSLWWAGDSGNSFACPQCRGISPGDLSSCCTSEPCSSRLECKEQFSSTHWPTCPWWTGWVPTQITFSVPWGRISPVFAVSQTRCYQGLYGCSVHLSATRIYHEMINWLKAELSLLLCSRFFLIYLSCLCPFVETNPSKSVLYINGCGVHVLWNHTFALTSFGWKGSQLDGWGDFLPHSSSNRK